MKHISHKDMQFLVIMKKGKTIAFFRFCPLLHQVVELVVFLILPASRGIFFVEQLVRTCLRFLFGGICRHLGFIRAYFQISNPLRRCLILKLF